MASIWFHLANSNSSSGATIWMPALLTRVSRRPKGLDRLDHARLDLLLGGEVHRDANGGPVQSASSAATESAPAWFKSAMATLAPSRRKVRAISLPMPLAAPVTRATRLVRRTVNLLSAQIVVDDLAEAEGEIGDDMDARQDLEHGQFGHRRQRVRVEVKCRRPGPGAFDRDVLKVVLD